MAKLEQLYEHDKEVWDECAQTYEKQIVQGHPDVTAYEEFEEDFLERVVHYLTVEFGHSISLYDFGCGSGRLHLLFGRHMHARNATPGRGRVAHIGGIDFSAEMIQLAKEKLENNDLGHLIPQRLSFDVGSAFEVPTYAGPDLPVAVSVCNSVGVMQGPQGAKQLFESVKRYAAQKNGLAIISGYRKEALATHGLGNYESTMDVCGQPSWLLPKIETDCRHRPISRNYKRAYSTDTRIVVDIFDKNDNCVKENVVLQRDPQRVEQLLETGIVTTHGGYNSQWYSMEQFAEWINDVWGAGNSWHVACRDLDMLRGAPAQLAIFDPSGLLNGLAQRWQLSR